MELEELDRPLSGGDLCAGLLEARSVPELAIEVLQALAAQLGPSALDDVLAESAPPTGAGALTALTHPTCRRSPEDRGRSPAHLRPSPAL